MTAFIADRFLKSVACLLGCLLAITPTASRSWVDPSCLMVHLFHLYMQLKAVPQMMSDLLTDPSIRSQFTLTHAHTHACTHLLAPACPHSTTQAEVAKYPNAEVIWALEEAKNMGPWPFVHDRIMTATRELNGDEVRARYIGRKTMASPAEGCVVCMRGCV